MNGAVSVPLTRGEREMTGVVSVPLTVAIGTMAAPVDIEGYHVCDSAMFVHFPTAEISTPIQANRPS